MSQIEKSVIRGLIRPHPRLSVWDAETGEYDGSTRLGGLKSAGPKPGVPVPQQESELVLQATGEQTWNQRLRVAVHRSGMPGSTGTFRWRYEGDTGVEWRGWDYPTVITDYTFVTDTSSYGVAPVTPHAVVTSDGDILCVYQARYSSSFGVRSIRSTGGTSWDGVGVSISENSIFFFDPGTEEPQGYNPCLVKKADGSIFCFHWANGNVVKWRYNPDETWTLAATDVLPAAIDTGDFHCQRLRAAEKDGQILLIACLQATDTALATEHILVQYASSDDGNSFAEVYRQDTSSAAGGAYQDIVVQGGNFVIAALLITSVANYPICLKIGSAYTPLSDLSPVTIDIAAYATGTDYLTDGDLCLAVDDQGDLWFTARRYADQVWTTFVSHDGGDTWDAAGANALDPTRGTWWRAGTSDYPTDACAVFCEGRMVVLSVAEVGGAYNQLLRACYLGGWSNVTLPALEANMASSSARATYTTTWLPLSVPDSMGWSSAIVGAPTAAITSGAALDLGGGSGDGLYYTIINSGSIDYGIIAEAILEVEAGIGRFEVRHSNLGEGYACTIKASPTNVTVSDAVSNTLLDTHVITGKIGVRVSIRFATLRVWVRSMDGGSDSLWTEISSATLTDDGGATFTGGRVRFGITDADAATKDVHFYFVGFVDDEGGSDNFVGPNLTDLTITESYGAQAWLRGRPLSASPTYVDGGTFVAALDGPGNAKDEWDIDTRYSHPIEAMLPEVEPSPARGWRSADIGDFDASCDELHIAFRMDADGEGDFLAESCGLENDLLGVYLDGLNFPRCYVDLYYAGAWHSTTSTSGVAFEATRTGSTLRPAAGNSAGVKVRFGELVGSHIAFHNASYTTTNYVSTVASNTEGTTRTDAVSKTTAITLSTADSGSTTTPYVTVWPRRHLLVIHPSAYSSEIQAFRLRIPVPTASGADSYPGRPKAGYYEIGKCVFGPILAFGHDYSWAHNATITPNVDLVTARDGSRKSTVLGSPRETWEIGWADGIDTTNYHQETASDYIKASANSTARPVAFRHDLPYLIQDFVRAGNGPDSLVVFLPSIAYDSNSGSTGDTSSAWTNFASGAVYGRITSPVRIETVVGEELSDEVLRVSSLTIEGEV